jgi:hypothetical protein
VNPDRYLEEPEPTDRDELDAVQDTRASNDADNWRKER